MPDRKTAVSAVLGALTAVSTAGALVQGGRTRDFCIAALVWSAGTLAAVLTWGET